MDKDRSFWRVASKSHIKGIEGGKISYALPLYIGRAHPIIKIPYKGGTLVTTMNLHQYNLSK